MTFLYPDTLINTLRSEWAKTNSYTHRPRPSLPDDNALKNLLEICYHASFLREEGRKLAFRVAYYPHKEFEQDNLEDFRQKSMLLHTNRSVLFAKPRAFSVAELHRLAPAAEYVRSLIGVELNAEGQWVTWGLIDTGANWWNFIHHETSGGVPPPPKLTISSGIRVNW